MHVAAVSAFLTRQGYRVWDLGEGRDRAEAHLFRRPSAALELAVLLFDAFNCKNVGHNSIEACVFSEGDEVRARQRFAYVIDHPEAC